MLIIPPKTNTEFRQKIKAFITLFDLKPTVRISGTLIELKTQDIVFLRNKLTTVLNDKEVDGELYFLINVDGESVWVRKYLDDFEMDFS